MYLSVCDTDGVAGTLPLCVFIYLCVTVTVMKFDNAAKLISFLIHEDSRLFFRIRSDVKLRLEKIFSMPKISRKKL